MPHSSSVTTIELDGDALSLKQLHQMWEQEIRICLGNRARGKVQESQEFVMQSIKGDHPLYGINTGFGKLAHVRIDRSKLDQLQENLIRSHSVGVGEPLSDDVVRMSMILKVNALAKGYSGVRPELIDLMCALISESIFPIVPSQGSVGASGDLAPLAHIANALIGEGSATRNGTKTPVVQAMEDSGLIPLQLAPKEGLALLNGTQVSTALALIALFKAERILFASLIAGAMSAEATKSSDTPFDPRIHRVAGHPGQLDVSKLLQHLMSGSQIRASHVSCKKVQDPYSIRCQPQVMGACLDALHHAAEVLRIESNSVTDNPIVFAGTDAILSSGNFHAEPIAMVSDYMALSIAEIGALSERRIALLMDSNMSQLPEFLVKDTGVNSGFMMAQVTAASLASENKVLAHPACVDSIPTSANQEDHVSMSTFAARRLHDMLANTSRIVAIELIAAAQGIEFRRPLKSSQSLEQSFSQVRTLSAPYVEDRSLAKDIEAVSQMVVDGGFDSFAQSMFPSTNA
ncbi:MAG: histidine ammonia-lyase [Gammaproteobacteria bacterium]|nr:histidine ammonia-lyase [Gammaproteobacteria bacterium]